MRLEKVLEFKFGKEFLNFFASNTTATLQSETCKTDVLASELSQLLPALKF